MTKHNRNYLTKEEHSARLAIFKQNLELVRSHDPVATGFKIGINKFSDLSVEEFKRLQGFKEIQNLSVDLNKFLAEDEEDSDESPIPREDEAEPEEKAEHGRGLQSYPSSLDWR